MYVSFMLIHCNMIDFRINYEPMNTVTVQEVYENDSYEFRGKKHIITLRVEQTWALLWNIFCKNSIGFSSI